MAAGKNQDIIELIIEGKDEYSDVSAEVRKELGELTGQAKDTREEFNRLETALDLADTYRQQEAEVSRLAKAQALARVEVNELVKADRKAKSANLEVAESLVKARAELGSVRTATNAAQKAFDKTRESMRKFGTTIDAVESGQKTMRAEANSLGGELSKLAASQTSLIAKAKAQAESTKHQTAAYEESTAAIKASVKAYDDQQAAYYDTQAAQQKTVRDTANLTEEVRKQIAALEKGDITWEDYKRRVSDAGRASDLTGKQVAGITRSMDSQAVAARKSAQSVKDNAAEMARVESATAGYRIELGKLIDKYKKGGLSAERFEQAETNLRKKMRLSERQVESTRAEMSAYAKQLDVVDRKHEKNARTTDKLTHITRRLAQGYTVLLAAQKAADIAIGSGKAYAQAEDAMLGLQKTTTLTASEIQGMSAEMTRLSTEVTPTTANELMGVAEAAGRMGIVGAENIAAFTKSIDSLSSATGLAGDETAQAVAQILNVTGEAQSNVLGVSAAIADLGNNSATTEDQIVHFAKRLASDTATVGLTSAEVLGLGTSLAEMGLQAEGSSTVVGRSFRYIEDAVKGGGEPMLQLQRITGKTSEEITKAFGDNKVKLFSDFVAGMGRMQDGGKTLNSILSDMGIKSDENARILGLLTKRYEGMTGKVDLANAAFEKGTAHFEEMAKKSASLSSGFQKLTNQSHTLSKAVGEAFSDDLTRAMDSMREGGGSLEEAFAELGETLADVVEGGADFISAFGGLADILDTSTGGLLTFNGVISVFQAGLESLSATINLFVGGIAEIGIAWNRLTGDTAGIKEWEAVQVRAFERTAEASQKFEDRIANAAGTASRAYQDLRDAYQDNASALERMDAEQRAAVETILNSTGYLEGNDKAYRTLTRSIQRAAEEKRIVKGLSAEENKLMQGTIDLLMAQGMAEGEAIATAKERRAAAIEAAEAERKRALEKQAADKAEAKAAAESIKAAEDKEAATKSAATASVESLKKEEAAWRDLGLSQRAVTQGVSDYEHKTITALGTLLTNTEITSAQMRQAFESAIDGAKTEQEIKAITSLMGLAGDQGRLAGKDIKEAFDHANEALHSTRSKADKAKSAIKSAGSEARKSARKVEDLNDELKATGKDGAGAIENLTKVMQELVAEITKLVGQYSAAATEAERLAAAGGSAPGGVPSPSGGKGDNGSGGGNPQYTSQLQQVMEKLINEGRADVAEIVKEMVNSGDTPSTQAYGLEGHRRWWEAVEAEATKEADAIRRKRKDLDKFQRDIAAGDVKSAERFLQSREKFNDMGADVLAIISAARALIDNTGSGNPAPQQTNQTPSGTNNITLNFQRDGKAAASGTFTQKDAEAMMELLTEFMGVTQ